VSFMWEFSNGTDMLGVAGGTVSTTYDENTGIHSLPARSKAFHSMDITPSA
jgi:hypothetical protein